MIQTNQKLNALPPRSTAKSDRQLEQLTIWPYRSLPPKDFAIVMGTLTSFSFIIGLGFFFAGAWPVVGFFGLELLVVWGAFKLNYRAARFRETVCTSTEEVIVQSQSPNGQRTQKSLSLHWLRVTLSPNTIPPLKSRQCQKVIMSSHGEHVEVGKYLHPAEKANLWRNIYEMINRARTTRDAF